MSEEEKKPKKFTQTLEKEREKSRLLDMVQLDRQMRDSETTFFRGETLQTYSDVALSQFVGHASKPEWKKDYQYNLFDPITRDKVYAIISKSSGLFESQFFNTNKRQAKVSELITTVLDAFYRDSTRRLNEKEKNRLIMLSALTSPKAIWFEGWRLQKRTIREIEERDENGRITKTKTKKVIHYNGPWGELVSVIDIIPGSRKIRDIQEQPRLTWIPKMQIEEFRRRFPTSRFPEANKVQAHGRLFENDITDIFVRDDLKDNEVEVAHIFEKWDDRLSIIANGVLLTEINSPMPYAHKDYPFVWGGFEELSPFFWADMPLTMKLLDMQDMTNETLNLTLDMVWRALNETWLVGEGDTINDDELQAGGMIPVDNPNNFKKFDVGSSFGFQTASAMMDRARRSIESASLDAPSSGQSGSRQITAREALIAREAALEITTLFLQNMENMERDKAKLRVQNQLDRYQRPIEWMKRIGEDLTEDAVPIFREISVRDMKMEDGRKGTVNVFITDEARERKDLDEENDQSKEMSQTIDITPEFIRNIMFDVEIVANSSTKKSKALEVAENRAFLGDALASPEIFNVRKAAEDYIKSLGKKTDDSLVQDKGGAPQQRPEATPEAPGEFAEDSVESVLNQI